MSISSISKSKQALAPQQSLHFYKNELLATEVSLQGNRHIVWANDIPLLQLENETAAKILLVDLANSVFGVPPESVAYPPYGYPVAGQVTSLLAFAGQPWDSLAQAYPLGNGHRLFHSSMRRFGSPDTLSPFNRGGLNSYAYCEGDPINRDDPTGESFRSVNSWVSKTRRPFFQPRRAMSDPTISTSYHLAQKKLKPTVAFDLTTSPKSNRGSTRPTDRNGSAIGDNTVGRNYGENEELRRLREAGFFRQHPEPNTNTESRGWNDINNLRVAAATSSSGYKSRDNSIFGIVVSGIVLGIVGGAIGLGIWLNKASEIRES